MFPNSRIKYLTWNSLKKEAGNFLFSFNPENIVPVPIEDIAELKLGIKVFPIPGLQDIIPAESFLCSDLSQIVMDNWIYLHNENRCRFTYAHEIGHLILHSEFYKQANITNQESYMKFQRTITPQEEKILEFQAFFFAGYILLPNIDFRKEIERYSTTIGLLTLKDFQDLGQSLSTRYRVSGQVILRQFEKEFPELYKQLSEQR